tara:strand:- start:356 stop:601 length:246 start_codon:yes stop_codon:yes gene_type:complete
MVPVLHRHVKRMSSGIEVGHNGFDRPVSITVHHVAPVSSGKKFRVQSGIVRPWLRVRANPDWGNLGHVHSRPEDVRADGLS